MKISTEQSLSSRVNIYYRFCGSCSVDEKEITFTWEPSLKISSHSKTLDKVCVL